MRIEITRDDNDVLSGSWTADRGEREPNSRDLICDLIRTELGVPARSVWSVQIYRTNGTAITDDMPSDGTFVAYLE